MRFPIPSMLWPGRSSRRRSWAASRRPRRLTEPLLVEGLEPRRLLSVTINEFPVTKPTEILLSFDTVGPDGNIWFVELNGSPNAGIGRINVDTGAITDIPTGSRFINPYDLTTGPDGKVWFTDSSDNQLGEIDPTTFAITVFPLPTFTDPFGITAGPDGNLWFTAEGDPFAGVPPEIGQFNPTSHALAVFSAQGTEPQGITVGPDGNLWYGERTGNDVGEINPTTHALAEFPVPTAGAEPASIAAGPDGNLWFVENTANKIGEIDPDDPRLHRVPPPHDQQPSGHHHGGARRQPLVHGFRCLRWPDRSDQSDDPRYHRAPGPHVRRRAGWDRGRSRRQSLVHRGNRRSGG